MKFHNTLMKYIEYYMHFYYRECSYQLTMPVCYTVTMIVVSCLGAIFIHSNMICNYGFSYTEYSSLTSTYMMKPFLSSFALQYLAGCMIELKEDKSRYI